MDKYANFVNQIPNDIMKNTDMHICSDIVLFKPQTFIVGTALHTVDFHIVIPSTPPPDAYINGKLQSFERGKILAVNPGETWVCTRGYSTKQYLSLLIKSNLINKIAEEMGFSGDIRFLKLQNPFSYELIQMIRNFEKETTRIDKLDLMLDCFGIQIATLLLREFKTNFRKYSSQLSDREVYVTRAIEYMQTFFSTNITIDDICSEINVSPFYFIRIFKQKVGVSPHQYLLSVRIKKAKELLHLGRYSVEEVAMLCGFVSLPHFSNTFKSMTGHTPSKYKKMFFS